MPQGESDAKGDAKGDARAGQGHPDITFPAEGLCMLKKTSYEEFEKRVLEILSINQKQYEDRLSEKMDFIMSGKTDTADLVRNRLKEIIA